MATTFSFHLFLYIENTLLVAAIMYRILNMKFDRVFCKTILNLINEYFKMSYLLSLEKQYFKLLHTKNMSRVTDSV